MILFLSRFDPKKGIELLLEAFAQVGGEFHNCVLVIAGKGSEAYESRLRDLAAQLGIAGRVFWPGFVSGPQKAAAFGEATIFVLPSYSENFGIAAVEAMAAGVPVLLSDQVAVADDVREAHAGRVVRCEAAAIATALRELLADPTGRSTLARKGRDLVRDRYSLPEVGRKLIKLYESVMSK
jgi:glycosyltransferase involved in cell wall biosynthesis